MPWLNESDDIQLNFIAENKQTPRGYYRRTRWGGISQSSIFEYSLLDTIQCIYLPPLRDAERKLVDVRGSRLSRLLKNLHHEELEVARSNDEKTQLEKKFDGFYTDIRENDELISKANDLIRNQLKAALGVVFSQDVAISFSESDFSKIVESLRLLFFPTWNDDSRIASFRELSENSLGYNNLIYLATILAELAETTRNEGLFRVLLIEEPEAHLHPQLQTRLLKYLESEAKNKNIQIIVTSHSPTLTSAVSLDCISVLSIEGESKRRFTPLAKCALCDSSKAFLNRWLDVTKSILLFSKGVLLVEGIAEAMIVPELARIVLKDKEHLPRSLEEAGISVINMNGIYFKHFFSLFSDVDISTGEPAQGAYLNLKCSGITDNDPAKDVYPLPKEVVEGKNPALQLISKLNANSKNCRLYKNQKTFEYDLAMSGSNMKIMLQAYLDLLTTDGAIRQNYEKLVKKDWSKISDNEKSEKAKKLLQRIEDIGKGFYAQQLAFRLIDNKNFFVPQYIKDAILWVVKKDV